MPNTHFIIMGNEETIFTELSCWPCLTTRDVILIPFYYYFFNFIIADSFFVIFNYENTSNIKTIHWIRICFVCRDSRFFSKNENKYSKKYLYLLKFIKFVDLQYKSYKREVPLSITSITMGRNFISPD